MRVSLLSVCCLIAACHGRTTQPAAPTVREQPAPTQTERFREGDLDGTEFLLPADQEVVSEWYFDGSVPGAELNEMRVTVNAWDEVAAWDEGQAALPSLNVVDQIDACQLFDGRRREDGGFDFIGDSTLPVDDGGIVSLTFAGLSLPLDQANQNVMSICTFNDVGPVSDTPDFYRFFLRTADDLKASTPDGTPVALQFADVGDAAQNVVTLSRGTDDTNK